MTLNPKTISWLKQVKENFPAFSQEIFKETYLKPYPRKRYTPIVRPDHGAQHAARVASYIRILVNFCRKLGFPPEIIQLTEEEITLLQLAAIFHDAGRRREGKDIYEKDSAALFRQYLQRHNIDDPVALAFADYISHSVLDEKAILLDSADALDISRVRPALHLEKIKLYSLLKPEHRPSFILLAEELTKMISDQGNLKSDCAIQVYGEDLTTVAGTPNLQKKVEYEHSENCYKTIVADFEKFPLLSDYYHQNQLGPVEIERVFKSKNISPKDLKRIEKLLHSAQIILTDDDQFHLTFTSERARNDASHFFGELGKATEKGISFSLVEWRFLVKFLRTQQLSWLPNADFFIKSVNALHFNEFVDTIIFPNTRDPLIRNKPKYAYTVTGHGIFSRSNEEESTSTEVDIKTKTSQYTPSEKTGFSQTQSASLAWADFSPPLFSRDSKKTVGVAIGNKHVLLSDRLFIYSGATQNRPWDFTKREDAKKYFLKMKDKKLFSSQQRLAFKTALTHISNLDEYNEVLARLAWGTDDSCFVLVGSDTLEARLLAQLYANTIYETLLAKGLCKPDYQVPIKFYFPSTAELHYRPYTILEQHLDRRQAEAIYDNAAQRQKAFQKNNYEFLLALPDEKILKALAELLTSTGALESFITTGNYFILKALIKKLDIKNLATSKQYPTLFTDLLQVCLLQKHIDTAEYLLSASSYPNLPLAFNPYTDRDFLCAAGFADNVKIIDLLLSHSEHPIYKDPDYAYNFFKVAINQNYFNLIERLLKIPTIDVNAKDEHGLPFFILSIEKNLFFMVEKFLASPNLDFNVKDKNSKTAFIAALAYAGEIDFTMDDYFLRDREKPIGIILMLLENSKIDIHTIDKKKNSALHYAAKIKDPRVLKKLLASDLNVNAQNNGAQTPLHIAINFQLVENVKLLINTPGINLDLEDKHGETARSLVNKLREQSPKDPLTQEISRLFDDLLRSNKPNMGT